VRLRSIVEGEAPEGTLEAYTAYFNGLDLRKKSVLDNIRLPFPPANESEATYRLHGRLGPFYEVDDSTYRLRLNLEYQDMDRIYMEFYEDSDHPYIFKFKEKVDGTAKEVRWFENGERQYRFKSTRHMEHSVINHLEHMLDYWIEISPNNGGIEYVMKGQAFLVKYASELMSLKENEFIDSRTASRCIEAAIDKVEDALNRLVNDDVLEKNARHVKELKATYEKVRHAVA
jgi:hypothetical protein